MYQKELEKLIQRSMKFVIERGYNKKKRSCPQCGGVFEANRRDHIFCRGGKCYRKYHTVPGMIRKLLKGWD